MAKNLPWPFAVIAATLFFSGCAIGDFTSYSGQQQADDTGHVGRYQLLYAVTETSGSGPAIQTKTVWKIDTVTGQVWQFVSSTVGDKLRERFIPVETSQP